MTVIVYRDGVLAADTATFMGQTVHHFGEKIRNYGPDWVVAAGEYAAIEAFHSWFAAGWPDHDKPEVGDEEGSFGALVLHSDGVVSHFDYKLRRTERSGWAVEGAHCDYVLALLHRGATAREAVEMAIQHCAYAGGDVQVVTAGEASG